MDAHPLSFLLLLLQICAGTQFLASSVSLKMSFDEQKFLLLCNWIYQYFILQLACLIFKKKYLYISSQMDVHHHFS